MDISGNSFSSSTTNIPKLYVMPLRTTVMKSTARQTSQPLRSARTICDISTYLSFVFSQAFWAFSEPRAPITRTDSGMNPITTTTTAGGELLCHRPIKLLLRLLPRPLLRSLSQHKSQENSVTTGAPRNCRASYEDAWAHSVSQPGNLKIESTYSIVIIYKRINIIIGLNSLN